MAVYIAIDLKSFYASVECRERFLDPLNTNLVVADESRTNKTICLAISPALKTFGVSGRPRLYEVERKVAELNRSRGRQHPFQTRNRSCYLNELQADPSLDIDYLIAVPRMSLYMEYSRRIYEIYLNYVSEEDIFAYSIDEVFIDATSYLHAYESAHDMAMKMIRDVLNQTGITATAGIGDNLYLAKVAMDIEAKHMPADADGVRIAQLDERSYRQKLWKHQPLTDFWRIGRGIARRLEVYGIKTMGDLAAFSLKNDGILYEEFGINAELLIDHAWGYEPCTMKDIKTYKPSRSSLGNGQVLMRPYSASEALVVIREMIEELANDLLSKNLLTDRIALYVGYDAGNDLSRYQGVVTSDWYGKTVAKPLGVSIQLSSYTDSAREMMEAIRKVCDRKLNKELLVRRINIAAEEVKPKKEAERIGKYTQFDLFNDPEKLDEQIKEEMKERSRENEVRKAMLKIKNRYGKNSILKGISFEEAATGRQRNEQIGGHRK